MASSSPRTRPVGPRSARGRARFGLALLLAVVASSCSAAEDAPPDDAPSAGGGEAEVSEEADAAQTTPPGVAALDPSRFQGSEWTPLSTDPAGDGSNPALADGAAVSYRQTAGDTIWFRIELHDLPDPDVFGTNLVLDTDGDPSNGAAWWGANDDFHYDRLVTAWVTRRGDRFEGTIGVGDAAGAGRRAYTNLQEDNLALAVDPAEQIVYLGIAPGDLGSPGSLEVVVAVGSNQSWNDDIPDTGSARVPLAGG